MRILYILHSSYIIRLLLLIYNGRQGFVRRIRFVTISTCHRISRINEDSDEQKKLKLEIVAHNILRLESGTKCNEKREGDGIK